MIDSIQRDKKKDRTVFDICLIIKQQKISGFIREKNT